MSGGLKFWWIRGSKILVNQELFWKIKHDYSGSIHFPLQRKMFKSIVFVSKSNKSYRSKHVKNAKILTSKSNNFDFHLELWRTCSSQWLATGVIFGVKATETHFTDSLVYWVSNTVLHFLPLGPFFFSHDANIAVPRRRRRSMWKKNQKNYKQTRWGSQIVIPGCLPACCMTYFQLSLLKFYNLLISLLMAKKEKKNIAKVYLKCSNKAPQQRFTQRSPPINLMSLSGAKNLL